MFQALRNSLFIILIFLFSQCGKKQQKTTKTYLNLSDSAKYVGINTCKQCHQSIYNTFIETGMGKSFDLASHQKTSAKFDQHSLVYDKFKDFYYKPFWNKDTLKIKEFRLEGKDTVYQRTENISYIIGSGQHTNSHMINVNGYVFQAPLTFYTQKGHWDLPPGFENGNNSRFNRVIKLECMSCHNSYPKYVEGSENKFTEIPNGINCERCHGPGSIHVKEKMEGHLVDINKSIDYSIVNPAKLPVALQFEICQRCHLQGNAVLNEGKSFYDFKPGMHLSEVLNVFVPKYKGAESEYIMASHVERLKMSQCFIQTMKKVSAGTLRITDSLRPYKNALTCVTCHNPHVSVRVTGKEVFNNACKNCHNGDGNKVCSRGVADASVKTHDQIMSGNCVSCHMPRSGPIDIPHVTSTDHFIRKPVKTAEVNKIKDFLSIVCVNNPRADNKTIARGYINYFEKFDANPEHLEKAEKLLNGEINANYKELIHLNYLRKNYNRIIEIAEKVGLRTITTGQKKSFSNDDAWLDYRVGDAYFNKTNFEQAYYFTNLATALAPYNLEFKNRLGELLLKLNKAAESIEVFESIVKENPKYASVWSNLGFAYLVASKNIQKAEVCYNKALALDPDLELALMNKAGLLLYTERIQEAKKILLHIVKKYPGNLQAKNILSTIAKG